MSKVITASEYEAKVDSECSMCIVGHVTSSTAKVWLRTYISGSWHLILLESHYYDEIRNDIDDSTISAEDILFDNSKVIIEEASTHFLHDNTYCFEVKNLKPDCRYHYFIIASGKTREQLESKIIAGWQKPYSFRTDPKDDFRQISFGFYSCHDPFGRKEITEGLWNKFEQELKAIDARLTIGGGDQVYCDTHGERSWIQKFQNITTIEDLWDWLKRSKDELFQKFNKPTGFDEEGLIQELTNIYHTYYRIYWNFNSIKAVYSSFANYMMWDDHEIMDGWGSLTKAERMEKLGSFLGNTEPEMKEVLSQSAFKAAKRAYLNYQHLHNPSTNVTPEQNSEERRINESKDEQIWDYFFDKGRVGFYVLDTRNHHDVEHNPNGCKLLNEKQMQRFKDWLYESQSKGHKALFVVTAVPVVHWKDRWFYNRDRLLKKIGMKDDVIDEWGHETNIDERNELLEAICKTSHDSAIPITFLSGDVHCASAFRIRSTKYDKANVMNITASGISRKPAHWVLKYLVEGDGNMFMNDDIKLEREFRMVGKNNFLTLEITDDDEFSIKANIHYGQESDTMLQKYQISVFNGK